jgi:PAS domain S-box-containing protein
MPADKDTKSTPETDYLKELKENLRRSRSTLRAILQFTENIIIVLDKNGMIIEASNQVEKIFGISLEDIIGKVSWESFSIDEDVDRLKGYFSDRARGTGNPPSTYTLRAKIAGEESRFMRANVGFIPGTEERVVILKDLSEVLQEQQKTAKSEERYRTVVENIEDGIVICNEERILFANKSFCMMTGLSREDIYTFSPMYFLHEADRDTFKSLFLKSGKKKTGKLVFETGIKKGRKYLPAELSTTPMVYRDAEAILFSVRDMTQRYEAEKKFKESHSIMKAIVDNSPVGISVHDRNGTLLMANDSWRAIWSKSLENQKKMMIPRARLRMDEGDSYLGEFQDDVEAIYKNGGELFIPRIRLPNPASGGAEYISHHFYALMDDKGEVDKVVILTLDLTASLKTRFELEETREQYRELSGNIPVAVYKTTLESGGRIISANKEMYKMFFGEENGDFSNVSVKDLYVDPERRKELKEKLSENDAVRGFEAKLKRLDGSTFLASISARKGPGIKGKKEYIEGIIRDITDQRRVEEELQRIEHLESIGTLAGGIAHDFNNLLMVIQGNISLAQTESDPSEFSKHIDEAETSIEEATILARQLLTFAKGGVPIKKSVEIASFVKESVLFALRGSDVEAVFEFEDNIEKIEADREQIAHVIRNMVLNSVQAMTGSGKITVSCSDARIDSNSDIHLRFGDYVRISIKDTGKGIPPDDLKKIFNPYFTTKPDGSGLGLSTSYSIVSRHSGTIEVFSEEGRGTEFVIYLPAREPEKKSSLPQKEFDAKADTASAHILIMDDDPKIRRVLTGMLKVLGHRVTESSDGAEAVELYREHFSSGEPFDAVIMDLTIPGGMGGEAAIKILKEIDPDVRAIVSSGYATNPVLSNYSDYGFRGELVKPFRISTLKKEMKAILAQ